MQEVCLFSWLAGLQGHSQRDTLPRFNQDAGPSSLGMSTLPMCSVSHLSWQHPLAYKTEPMPLRADRASRYRAFLPSQSQLRSLPYPCIIFDPTQMKYYPPRAPHYFKSLCLSTHSSFRSERPSLLCPHFIYFIIF